MRTNSNSRRLIRRVANAALVATTTLRQAIEQQEGNGSNAALLADACERLYAAVATLEPLGTANPPGGPYRFERYVLADRNGIAIFDGWEIVWTGTTRGTHEYSVHVYVTPERMFYVWRWDCTTARGRLDRMTRRQFLAAGWARRMDPHDVHRLDAFLGTKGHLRWIAQGCPYPGQPQENKGGHDGRASDR